MSDASGPFSGCHTPEQGGHRKKVQELTFLWLNIRIRLLCFASAGAEIG